MENSKILQGNSLILKFLGYGWISDSFNICPNGYYINNITYEVIVLENSDFHRNWNALMPVVALCYGIDAPTKNGWSKADRIQYCIDDHDFFNNNVENVWLSVVEFIEWWYEEKNKSIE